MNANRIIDMIVRQVMRRLVNTGINKGIDLASRKGGTADKTDQAPGPRPSQNSKHTQRVTRQMRRFMKF